MPDFDHDTLMFFVAVMEGNLPAVKTDLSKDRRLASIVNPVSNDRESALHIAAPAGREDIVRELLAAGASPNACDVAGATPLHCAAGMGRSEIVALLLDHGADVEAKTSEGGTPWGFAAANNRVETARFIEFIQELRRRRKKLNPGHSYRKILDTLRARGSLGQREG